MKVKLNHLHQILLGLPVLFFIINATPVDKKTPKIGLKVGNQAPEIELYTPDGQLIKLSFLRGDIIFIDFWASWCKGCRVRNKSLDSLYNEYKDKQFIDGRNFQIFLVNLDIDSIRWLDAIEKDNLHHCINVSDLKGFDSPVAEDYKLTGFPRGYVIDSAGIIIGGLGNLKTILKEHCICDRY
jgi:thiol-disulfide isomerase/thioredoxin